MDRTERKGDNEMKLTILGPWGAYPAADSASASYLIQTESVNVLLDCGSGALAQLQRHLPLEELDAVVLTHYHTDHIADVYCLQHAAMILMQLGRRTKPIEIYSHDADHAAFATLAYGEYMHSHVIAVGDTLALGDLTWTFGHTTHPVPCLSMHIEHRGQTLVFTGDTAWNDDLVRIGRNADLLLCESNLYNEYFGKIGGHLTAGEAGRLASQCGAKRLVLTHLPQYGDLAQLVREAQETYQGPIDLARTGDQYRL